MPKSELANNSLFPVSTCLRRVPDIPLLKYGICACKPIRAQREPRGSRVIHAPESPPQQKPPTRGPKTKFAAPEPSPPPNELESGHQKIRLRRAL